MSVSSNPGAATPQGLHQIYAGRAATSANPYLLRDVSTVNSLRGVPMTREQLSSLSSHRNERSDQKERERLLIQSSPSFSPPPRAPAFSLPSARPRGSSPLRGAFRVVSESRCVQSAMIGQTTGIRLSLNSLDMRNK